MLDVVRANERELYLAISAWRDAYPWLADQLLILKDLYLFKGVFLSALVLLVGAGPGGRYLQGRNLFVVRVGVGALGVMFVARLLQNLLPHRDRPFVWAGETSGWGGIADSSFPSDHGVLMMFLATCIRLRSRPWGLFAIAWTLIVILTPRVLTGFHYPSDLVVGALIGVCGAIAAMRCPLPTRMARRLAHLEAAAPAAVYAAGLLFFYQLSTNFDDSRRFASTLLDLASIESASASIDLVSAAP